MDLPGDTGGRRAFYWTPPAHRKVDAQYLELRAPLLSARNDLPFVNLLELMELLELLQLQSTFRQQSLNQDGKY